MIRCLLFVWILALALAPTAAAQLASHSGADVDFGAVVRETQQTTREPGYAGIIWWTPVEFWEKAAERGGMSAEKAHELYKSLRSYTMIVTGVGKVGMGNINWVS